MKRPDHGAMVGREAELTQIASLLAGPSAAAFVIAGPAGVGKTRLATEAGAAAVSLGSAVVRVAATRAASSIPFGPFARFLPADDAIPGDRLELLHRLTTAIVERSSPGQQLVLIVDDAHELDDGSAALVHELAMSQACHLLLTVRSLETVPDSVTALWKDGIAVRLDLRPLAEPDVRALTESLLGGPVSGATIRRLNAASGGNPLWIRELVIGAVSSGDVIDSGGMWMLRDRLRAPDRLVEIVAARLAGLSEDTVAVLELLAAGGQLELALLEAHTSAAGLEDAERQGLSEIVHDERRTSVRLTHPIYGEVMRQQLPHSRLRRLWGGLAGTLQATGARRREDLLRLVTWQLDAGLTGDPALLSAAAQLAGRMSDKVLAARLARAAFDVGGGVEAGLALGVAEFSLGRHVEAEQLLAVLVRVCTTDAELSKIANARAYNLSILMGQPEAAAAVLEEALGRITDVSARLRLLGRLASNRLFDSQAAAALAAAIPLMDSEDAGVIAQGAYIASIASALLGRADDAVTLSERGMAAYLESVEENHQLPEIQLIGAVLGDCAAGRLAEADARANVGYQACLAAADKEGQATFSLLLGWVRVEQGRLAAAATAFLEAVSINRELKDPSALRWCLGGYALAEAMAGRAASATTALTEMDTVSGGVAIFELELIDRGRAWSEIAAGRAGAGRAALELAVQRAAASQQVVAEAHLLHDLVLLTERASGTVTDRLAELAKSADGQLVAVFAAHASAVHREAAADLAECVERFERLGVLRCAAEAARSAARLYRAQGLPRPANAWSAKSGELFAECGDEPVESGADERPDRLTPREREIAALAAAGHSSRDIAATLVVSVRTVDNHLQNAYTKLGVANRAELARVMATSGRPRNPQI